MERGWEVATESVYEILLTRTIGTHYKEVVREAVNLRSGKVAHVMDVARWINEETGNPAGVRHLERRRWDTKDRLLASVDKAKSTLGWEPRTVFRDGLRRTVEWFRAHWPEIQGAARF